MTIIHLVMFGFKPDVSEQEIKGPTLMLHQCKACDRMLSLKGRCLHPSSNKPYIKSSSGGKDNSPEGHQRGVTHAFVVEFDSAEDRDYYCFKDPVHQDFVKSIGGIVKDVQVNDYTPGVF